MPISEFARDSYQLITVSGILDGKTDESIKLHTILDAPSNVICHNYMLDVEGVEYMNSSMLGLLVKFLSSCNTAGKKLVLIKPSPSLLSIFDMIGLTHLIPVAEDEVSGCDTLGFEISEKINNDIDYDILADEIEEIITAEENCGKSAKETCELRKLLG